MADAYDGNGDYSSYNEDDNNDYGGVGGGGISRKTNGDSSNHHDHHHHIGSGVGGPHAGADIGQLNDKANEYLRDCLTEKNRMERKCPISEKLLDCEIEKVQTTGRIPSREQRYADIYREKPLRVSQKVLVPIREHPKFNFVGKLLGPKGNSLRRLQEETLCKMTVLGRSSMRDRLKEEELRLSNDPKYAHLNSDLHVEISTIAPPAEAYARIAYAMAELRKYLIPDSNDVIRQEQLRELMDNTGLADCDANGGNGGGKLSVSAAYKKLPHKQPSTGGGGCMTMGSSAGSGGNKNMQHHSYRTTQSASAFTKNTVAPKQKVLSILEKARTAMDETYGRGYDEHNSYEQPQQHHHHSHHHHQSSYDTYPSYGSSSMTGGGGGGSGGGNGSGTGSGAARSSIYDSNDYESEYNRRDYYAHSPSYGGGGTGGGGHSQHQTGSLNANHSRSHVR